MRFIRFNLISNPTPVGSSSRLPTIRTSGLGGTVARDLMREARESGYKESGGEYDVMREVSEESSKVEGE
jgi:hypothetical protein